MLPVALLLGALQAAAAPAVSSGKANASCQVELLTELGWQFRESEARAAQILPGQPCERVDLAQAHAMGDLRVSIPAHYDATQRATVNEQLLRHPATHCAFSMRLGQAARDAIDRLVANEDFRFSALQTGWIGFGIGGAKRDGWRATRSFGRGFIPASSPSRAVAAFYDGSIRAECGVGRQIAQYATLLELFGAADFDAAYAPDEIMIGTFNQLNRSDSVLLGRRAGVFSRDGLAVAASRQGRQAFAALPGFIFHVFDSSTLDDISNQAENFIVYDVGEAGAAALRAAGGFERFNERALELWTLSQGLELSAHRIFERLLFERDEALLQRMSPHKIPTLRRMQQLLSDPFFQQFRIYVHPLGVKPVAFHFARLLDRNPRTPFRIELGLHNLHTTHFDRWIGQRLRACIDAGSGARQSAVPGSAPTLRRGTE